MSSFTSNAKCTYDMEQGIEDWGSCKTLPKNIKIKEQGDIFVQLIFLDGVGDLFSVE